MNPIWRSHIFSDGLVVQPPKMGPTNSGLEVMVIYESNPIDIPKDPGIS